MPPAFLPTPSLSPVCHKPQPSLRPPSLSATSSADHSISHAVVIGGGPTGLATALKLRTSRLAKRITLLERSLPQQIRTNTTRQYSLQIAGPVVNFMYSIPGLRDAVKEYAQPVDPCFIHIFSPDGADKLAPFPIFGPEMERYWVRRCSLMDAFLDTLNKPVEGVDVEVFHGATCDDVVFDDDEHAKVVFEHDGQQRVVEADLIVGADGVRSSVKAALHREFLKGTVSANGSGMGFENEKWTSPSVGLGYKCLHIPSSIFHTSLSKAVHMEHHTVYVLKGKAPRKARYASFSIVCLPIGSPRSFGRVGTIVCKPDHPLITASDSRTVIQILEESLPHIDVRRTFPNVDEFAEARTPHFPHIQRAGSLVSHYRKTAFALVGDALHCFPPDLGLGVNSGIEDVTLLCESLQHGLHTGVDVYEEKRDVDVRALMRLHVIGFPYQYRQNMLGFYANVADRLIRTKLSELMPTIFYPSIGAILRQGYSYSEAERLMSVTTRRMKILAALIATLPVIFLFW